MNFFYATLLTLLLSCYDVQGKRLDIADETNMMEYFISFLKVTFACSPIIIIALMLICAREDEEEEKAKLEAAKKADSCKT